MTSTATTEHAAGHQAATEAPPEWWERAAGALGRRRERWATAHPRAAAAWTRFLLVRGWVSLAWLVAVVVFVPTARGSVRVLIGSLVVLLVWFVLARTKTVSWRTTTVWFTAGMGWGMCIGWFTVHFAEAIGLRSYLRRFGDRARGVPRGVRQDPASCRSRDRGSGTGPQVRRRGLGRPRARARGGVPRDGGDAAGGGRARDVVGGAR